MAKKVANVATVEMDAMTVRVEEAMKDNVYDANGRSNAGYTREEDARFVRQHLEMLDKKATEEASADDARKAKEDAELDAQIAARLARLKMLAEGDSPEAIAYQTRLELRSGEKPKHGFKLTVGTQTYSGTVSRIPDSVNPDDLDTAVRLAKKNTFALAETDGDGITHTDSATLGVHSMQRSIARLRKLARAK